MTDDDTSVITCFLFVTSSDARLSNKGINEGVNDRRADGFSEHD